MTLPESPQEVTVAAQLVKSLAAPFKPGKYEDEYQKRLLELIEAKAKGKPIKAEPKSRKAPVIDLMEALKKSLAEKPAAAKRRAARRMAGHLQLRKRARAF